MKTGAQFVVVGDNDVVIPKNIAPPSIEEFDELVAKTQAVGKHTGLKKTDIAKAIEKAREAK